jgi:hypothetical protein
MMTFRPSPGDSRNICISSEGCLAMTARFSYPARRMPRQRAGGGDVFVHAREPLLTLLNVPGEESGEIRQHGAGPRERVETALELPERVLLLAAQGAPLPGLLGGQRVHPRQELARDPQTAPDRILQPPDASSVQSASYRHLMSDLATLGGHSTSRAPSSSLSSIRPSFYMCAPDRRMSPARRMPQVLLVSRTLPSE